MNFSCISTANVFILLFITYFILMAVTKHRHHEKVVFRNCDSCDFGVFCDPTDVAT